MASNNGWFDFMNSRAARIVCDALVIIACARYAGQAGYMMLNPDEYVATYEAIGTTGFYVMCAVQLLVCLVVVVQFARMLAREIAKKDE